MLLNLIKPAKILLPFFIPFSLSEIMALKNYLEDPAPFKRQGNKKKKSLAEALTAIDFSKAISNQCVTWVKEGEE